MRPPEILQNLRNLKETWRNQSFSFSGDQRAQYDRLIALRRERVKYMYDNDMVYKGGTKQATPTK
tara:strand:+ start:235 stop:429 length:195 start_codon:yes stop_codon:yes gene_type:complete